MYLIKCSLLILILFLSPNLVAQTNNWIIHTEDVYLIDSEQDTLWAYSSYVDSTNSLIVTFPEPLRVERDYYLYITWEDTLGFRIPDSLGLFIPPVSKLQQFGIEW